MALTSGFNNQKYAKILSLILILLPTPSLADDLQDRLNKSIKSFTNVTPEYPDIALSWAQYLIGELAQDANPSDVLTTDKIGDWVLQNRRKGKDKYDDDLRLQRMQWLVSPMQVWMKGYPPEPITGIQVILRLQQSIKILSPPPPPPPPPPPVVNPFGYKTKSRDNK